MATDVATDLAEGIGDEDTHHPRLSQVSKIQLVVFYQCCVLIGWANTRLYVIAH